MTQTYFATTSVQNDLEKQLDEFNRYHQQYFRFSGNFDLDTVMHAINMLILQVLLQMPFVYVMWPKQNMLRVMWRDRQLVKKLKAESLHLDGQSTRESADSLDDGANDAEGRYISNN